MFRSLGLAVLMTLACLSTLQDRAEAQQKPATERRTTFGFTFEIYPELLPRMEANLKRIRQDIQQQRDKDKFIVYLSVPISARGGGHTPTNLAISALTKKRIEAQFGSKLWVMDPGVYEVRDNLAPEPQGGDYMNMWIQVILGSNGKGDDFDMFYFQGPSDVRAFFGAKDLPIIEAVERYIQEQSARDPAFRKEVGENPTTRKDFLRFYALRASTAYSKGAHDEWNILTRLNRVRGVGESIAAYFDGRPLSPAEMESDVAPGYQLKPQP
jgi:hypothetical protein